MSVCENMPGFASQNLPESNVLNPFRRIFGIETEYGISVTGTEKPVDPAVAASILFKPIVMSCGSANTYVSNGSRLYLDVGAHPEYASAEACNPLEALASDAAGEEILRKTALRAENEISEKFGGLAKIHLFKNNVDSAGNSFGCHENYLIPRHVSLAALKTSLISFLVTRQIFCGAGRFADGRFEITQRARFVDEDISSAVTQSRPMINTRDEPHADSDKYRRLHVIIGDSNRSQIATWLKLAATHLVLCVIEYALQNNDLHILEELNSLELQNQAESMRGISGAAGENVSYFAEKKLALANSDKLSAMQIQRKYLRIVKNFISQRDSVSRQAAQVLENSVFGKTAGAEEALQLWEQSLEAVQSGELSEISRFADWAAKKRLFDALKTKTRQISDLRIKQLDFDYHDIVRGKTFPSLEKHGLMRTIFNRDDILKAVENPPDGTRAVLRAEFVKAARKSSRQWAADWTHASAGTGQNRIEAQMPDPFDSVGGESFKKLMRSLKE